MKSTKIPRFDLGNVFPSDEPQRVYQMRFLMACQALAAIARLLDLLPNTPATRESKNYLMALSIGAANEASIAFLEADAEGAFTEVIDAGWQEMVDRIERLRVDCDDKQPNSLRKRILLVARNTMGFHWDPKTVRKSLARLKDAEVAVWAGGEDQTVASTALPIVSAIIHDALEHWVGSKVELDTLMKDIASLQGDFSI